MTLVAYKHS